MRDVVTMTQLDPNIVERYAEHLERKASSRIMGFTIVSALGGSILGSVALVAPNRVLVPHTLGLALLLIGAAAGGYLGYTMGVRRAEGLRLQAQMTLHQLQVERALVQRAAVAAVAAVAPVLPSAAAPPVPAPAPAPAAVPVAPAPAAPPPTHAAMPPLSSPPAAPETLAPEAPVLAQPLAASPVS